MNDRSAGIWVVLLVALAGVLHVAPVGPQTGGQAGKQTPPVAQPAQLDEVHDSEQSVITELEKFYLVNPDKDRGCRQYFGFARQSSGRPEKSGCETMDLFKKSGSLAVIAVVPDPLDAHAAYRFD